MLASLLYEEGKISEAVDTNQQTINLYSHLILEENHKHLRTDLARSLEFQAILLWWIDKTCEVFDTLQQAIDIYTQLIHQDGRKELYHDLANCILLQVGVLVDQGKIPEAYAEYQPDHQSVYQIDSRREPVLNFVVLLQTVKGCRHLS